jgi:hypothetical protein
MRRNESIANHFANNGTSVSIDTEYLDGSNQPTKKHSLDFNQANEFRFESVINCLVMNFSGLSGSPTKCYFKITTDSDGNYSLFGESDIELDLGISDQTKASASAKIDMPFSKGGTEEKNRFYLFVRLDRGAGTLTYSQLSAAT